MMCNVHCSLNNATQHNTSISYPIPPTAIDSSFVTHIVLMLDMWAPGPSTSHCRALSRVPFFLYHRHVISPPPVCSCPHPPSSPPAPSSRALTAPTAPSAPAPGQQTSPEAPAETNPPNTTRPGTTERPACYPATTAAGKPATKHDLPPLSETHRVQGVACIPMHTMLSTKTQQQQSRRQPSRHRSGRHIVPKAWLACCLHTHADDAIHQDAPKRGLHAAVCAIHLVEQAHALAAAPAVPAPPSVAEPRPWG